MSDPNLQPTSLSAAPSQGTETAQSPPQVRVSSAGERDGLRQIVLALVIAVASSYLHFAVSHTLRVDESGLSRMGTFAFYTGIGLCGVLASVGYLRIVKLRQDARFPHHASTHSLSSELKVALLLQLLASLSLPLSSNDVFSNLAYGRLADLGHNPYLSTPRDLPLGDPFAAMVGKQWYQTPIAYGPILAWLNQLTTTDTVVRSLILFKVVFLLVSSAIVFVCYLICRDSSTPLQTRSAFVLVGWNPLLAWEIAGQAHNDGVMVLLLCGFVWAALRRKELLAVVLLTLAMCAKFAAVAVLGLYLVMILRKAPIRAIALGLLSLILTCLLFAPFWHETSALKGPAATLGGDPTRVSNSIASLVVRLCTLASPDLVPPVYKLCWLVGTSVLGVCFLRGVWKTRTLDDVFHFSALTFLLYYVVGAPWFLCWYSTWVLPLALVQSSGPFQRLLVRFAQLSSIEYLPLSPVSASIIDIFTIRSLLQIWPLRQLVRFADRTPAPHAATTDRA